MTIRQIVLFSFPEPPDDGYFDRLSAGVEALVAAVPDVASASWGRDVGPNPDNADFALVMDFADRDALLRYKKHPAHLAFIEAYMRERPMKKVRIQYALP